MTVAISGVLVAGIGASVAISLKGLPTLQTSPAGAMVKANRAVDRFATELETAIYVTERSATAIGFTVPDRNGDGIAERIRYAWSGTPGGNVTRQYNGGSIETIASNVQQFTLNPSLRSVSESYPNLAVEEATDSLLVDYNSTVGTSNIDVMLTNWLGQTFQATLPSNVVAWRPTSVRLMAKRSLVPGVTLVQMRQTDANFVPLLAVLEQSATQIDLSLSSSYAWKEFAFTTLDPIAPDGSICLVLVPVTGPSSCTVQQSGSFAGRMQSTVSGVGWNYDTQHALVSQLYGRRTMTDGTQRYVATNYVMSVDVVLQMTATSPAFRATGSLLNHPELLSGFWELKFDQNPTSVDGNGDAAGDWVVHGGGTFNMSTLSNGVWYTSSTQLDTNPGCDFAKTTIVDVRLRNTSVGGNGAIFAINALRSGSNCAPILAYLKLQPDGTQSLTISKKTADATAVTLLNVTGLSNQAVDLHLIIDPVTSAVSVGINGVLRGTFGVTKFASADSSRVATIGASGSSAEFSYMRIRVME